MKRNELAEMVERELEENNIWASAYEYGPIPILRVEINKGDWKHDHWACDEIVDSFLRRKEIRNIRGGEITTWEDGSDCYSSIHQWAVPSIYREEF